MTHDEKMITPHAVYRFFGAGDELLYVGCTFNVRTRMDQHRGALDWYHLVVKITLEWHPGWVEGVRAEAAAILAENPLHNKRRSEPANCGVGSDYIPHPRGDGLHCPKCGKPKEDSRPGRAYCRSCQHDYQLARRVAAGWIPRPPPTTVCPRCAGPKEPGPSYCKKCKSQINRAYKKSKKEQKVALTKS
jgi:predicted GIY-YIG superfamily endonuclease